MNTATIKITKRKFAKTLLTPGSSRIQKSGWMSKSLKDNAGLKMKMISLSSAKHNGKMLGTSA